MIQIQIHIRIHSERDENWIFNAVREDTHTVIATGSALTQRMAEARVYRACADYMRDIQRLAETAYGEDDT